MKKKLTAYDEARAVMKSAGASRADNQAKWTKARDDAAAQIAKATADMEAATDPDAYLDVNRARVDAEGLKAFYELLRGQEKTGLLDKAKADELAKKVEAEELQIVKDAEADLRPRMKAIIEDAINYMAELQVRYEVTRLLKANTDWLNYIEPYNAPDLFKYLQRIRQDGLYNSAILGTGGPTYNGLEAWNALLEEKKKILRSEL